MRIGIDLWGAEERTSRYRGHGRYSHGLAKALVQALLGREDKPEVYLYSHAGQQGRMAFQCEGGERILLPPPKPPCDSGWGLSAIDEHIHERGNPEQLDALLLLSPHQSYCRPAQGKPRILAVAYDLIPLTDPAGYLSYRPYADAFHGYLTAAKKWDRLLAISRFAEQEFLAAGFKQEQVLEIGFGLEPVFEAAEPGAAISTSDVRTLQKFGVAQGRYLVHNGSQDPRKGGAELIEAWSKLPPSWQNDYPLVFAYAADSTHANALHAVARECRVQGHVYLVGQVSDEDLAALYRNARLAVYPSKHEGLGLPIAEAQGCGCFVIYGDNTGQSDADIEPRLGLGVNASDIKEIARALFDALAAKFDPDSQREIARYLTQSQNWGHAAKRVAHALYHPRKVTQKCQ